MTIIYIFFYHLQLDKPFPSLNQQIENIGNLSSLVGVSIPFNVVLYVIATMSCPSENIAPFPYE